MTDTFATIDDYIGSFPAEVQIILHEVRRTIADAVPGAEEKISYHIPTITLGGRNVMHFGAWKNHIALYPTPTGSRAFEREIALQSGQKHSEVLAPKAHSVRPHRTNGGAPGRPGNRHCALTEPGQVLPASRKDVGCRPVVRPWRRTSPRPGQGQAPPGGRLLVSCLRQATTSISGVPGTLPPTRRPLSAF
jgi:uncharacterized protein YdhG (YjbR/CyaY superfamily)